MCSPPPIFLQMKQQIDMTQQMDIMNQFEMDSFS